jgi:hypothetical protein
MRVPTHSMEAAVRGRGKGASTSKTSSSLTRTRTNTIVPPLFLVFPQQQEGPILRAQYCNGSVGRLCSVVGVAKRIAEDTT